MRITYVSFAMSIVWGSFAVVGIHFCRKKPFFIRKLGVRKLLLLYFLSVVRMMVPCEFPFTRAFLPEGFWVGIGKNAYTQEAEAALPLVFSVLALIWAGVSVVLLVRFGRRYMKSMQECLGYKVCEGARCQMVFRKVLNECGGQMEISVRQSRHIRVPMGIGILKKSILLPEGSYSDSELYYILLHEYTHFRNRDLLVKSLVSVFCCIYWWNPAVYLLKKDLPHLLEIQCDLDVTEGMQDRDKADYLRAIVSVLKNAGAKRKEKTFYGAAMLVAGTCVAETVERFRLVSMEPAGKEKSRLLAASWLPALLLLFYLSYAFAAWPGYGSPGKEAGAGFSGEDYPAAEADSFVDIMRNTESTHAYLRGRR